ncbi:MULTISPECIES: hypothetical protein [unclassified Bacillus (in: firmicutes)]|uniref:hypothetical protein n=1 Tax=unclassified Bacillus (in: firmicutes) TaxID=185979 RepID=UPI001BE65E5C|nr:MULTISPECIES: hypothetical protein [unclassified Bacillus (in: firmicutes)]MBT2618541.1 hypothetical protein [Bacillus sp. ISL-78]MBT2632231.1 hypothetical protein [Bacillus sp. ISL-101]MBT2718085.1 hypothetical protein [Bacillus sp. ISL-57]
MRNVDIHQCNHNLTHSPIYVSGWLVGYKSFFSKGLILAIQVIFPQLLSDYRQVNYYENLRKTEISRGFAFFIEGV